MESKVTIVVPIYNVEKYIAKCLKSLVNQSFKDIEIWAIDDGSPDNSAVIVKKFAQKDPRVKLIEKENGGYGSVLEFAANNISSEYFLICDPDDWLNEDAVEILLSKAEKGDLDIVVADKFNVYIGSEEKKYIKTFRSNIKPNIIYTDKKKIQEFSLGMVSPHAKLYRTKLAKGMRLPHKVSYTDYVLYLLCLSKASKVEYINVPLAYYLIDRIGNTATDKKVDVVEAYLKGWNAVLDQLENPQLVGVILFREYLQLKFIISEYSKRTNNLFMDKYYDQLIKSCSRLSRYKHQIYPNCKAMFTKKDKLIFGFLTNKITQKYFLRKYINYKRLH